MIRTVCVVVACAVLLGCADEPCSRTSRDERRKGRAELRLEMDKGLALCVLKELGAEDISAGMQVGGVDEEGNPLPPAKDWMWSVPGYDVHLGVYFTGEKITAIEFWDANTLQPTYHHNQEHSKLSRITFDTNGQTYRIDQIEIVPAGTVTKPPPSPAP